ncbi:Oxidoreductase andH, partial [Lachnellula arida]
MVNIKDVRASNAAFKKSNSGLVAVFVGATSGIGMGTLKQFAKHANSPTIYIVGRSQSAARALLDELSASNPDAVLNFIETEVSLMKNVDRACDEIKSKETKVDILFVSPGYLSFDGRNESSEGIDIPHALRYYTRLRFTYALLPLLTLSPNPHVISILAGGRESALDLRDLELKTNFSGLKAMQSGTTQTTLAFEELAKTNPSVAFIHKYPGFVDTGVLERLLGTATGLWAVPARLARWCVLPVLNLFAMSTEEAGERGVFVATSARYPPLKKGDGW